MGATLTGHVKVQDRQAALKTLKANPCVTSSYRSHIEKNYGKDTPLSSTQPTRLADI